MSASIAQHKPLISLDHLYPNPSSPPHILPPTSPIISPNLPHLTSAISAFIISAFSLVLRPVRLSPVLPCLLLIYPLAAAATFAIIFSSSSTQHLHFPAIPSSSTDYMVRFHPIVVQHLFPAISDLPALRVIFRYPISSIETGFVFVFCGSNRFAHRPPHRVQGQRRGQIARWGGIDTCFRMLLWLRCHEPGWGSRLVPVGGAESVQVSSPVPHQHHPHHHPQGCPWIPPRSSFPTHRFLCALVLQRWPSFPSL